MKTAHYYASRTNKFVVFGTDGVEGDKKFPVSGKADAKKLAAQHGAKPWNF